MPVKSKPQVEGYLLFAKLDIRRAALLAASLQNFTLLRVPLHSTAFFSMVIDPGMPSPLMS